MTSPYFQYKNPKHKVLPTGEIPIVRDKYPQNFQLLYWQSNSYWAWLFTLPWFWRVVMEGRSLAIFFYICLISPTCLGSFICLSQKHPLLMTSTERQQGGQWSLTNQVKVKKVKFKIGMKSFNRQWTDIIFYLNWIFRTHIQFSSSALMMNTVSFTADDEKCRCVGNIQLKILYPLTVD